MNIIKEMKEESEFEGEVRKRVQSFEFNGFNADDNISLQIFVMENDIKRYESYLRGGFRAKYLIPKRDWKMSIEGLKGFLHIYKSVLEIGSYNKSSVDFLQEQSDLLESFLDDGDDLDSYDRNYFICRLIAVEGLKNGVLYYSWDSRGANLISHNPRFLMIAVSIQSKYN